MTNSTSTPAPTFAEWSLHSGYAVATDEVCDSFVLLPGMALWNPTLLAVLYFVTLIYLFIGISGVAVLRAAS